MTTCRRPSPCRGLPRLVLSLWLALWAGLAAAAPVDLVLVLDNSGSMRGNDPGFLLKTAVRQFVDSLDADTRVGIVIFAEKADYSVPLGVLDDSNRQRIASTIDSIDYRGKLTNSPAAVERAIYELKGGARPDAAKVIVFMTDGIVDTGDKGADVAKAAWLREELAADAADSGIRVFGIAFTENADFFLIQSLSKRTDGEYFRALTPEDLAGVFAAVQGKLAAPPATAEAPAAPAPAPAPAAVAPAAPAPVAPAPAAVGDCLSTLAPDERTALEQMSEEAGLTAEQLCAEMQQAPPGSAVVVPAEGSEDDMLGAAMIIGAAALLLAVVVAAVVLLRRRSGQGGVSINPRAVAAVAVAPSVPEAFIKDVNGITGEPAVQLGAKPLIVGRVAGSDSAQADYFVVDKPTIGRRHAVIRYHDFGFRIADQGSVNGTFVNGERIEHERQLKHGDRVKFHKYEFLFSMPEMEDAGRTVFANADATIVGDATMMGGTLAGAAAAALAAGTVARAVDRDDAHADIFGDGSHDDDGATSLSARARAAAADLGDETAEGESASLIAPLARQSPVTPAAQPAPPAAPARIDDEAFDAEASAFFDDGLGLTAGPPLQTAAPVLDDGDFDGDFAGLDTGAAEAATAINPGGDFSEAATAIFEAADPSEAATAAFQAAPDFAEAATAVFQAVDPSEAATGVFAAPPAESGTVTFSAVDPSAIEDTPPNLSTVVLPGSPVSRRPSSEDATVMPADVPDDPLEGTSDISLDDFMRTDTFDGPLASVPPLDDEDDDDATLMPEQVPAAEDGDDIFGLTDEGPAAPGAKAGDDEDDATEFLR